MPDNADVPISYSTVTLQILELFGPDDGSVDRLENNITSTTWSRWLARLVNFCGEVALRHSKRNLASLLSTHIAFTWTVVCKETWAVVAGFSLPRHSLCILW